MSGLTWVRSLKGRGLVTLFRSFGTQGTVSGAPPLSWLTIKVSSCLFDRKVGVPHTVRKTIHGQLQSMNSSQSKGD